MRRKSLLKSYLDSNKRGGILDVPQLGILRHQSPMQLVTAFEGTWGARPEAVVLPVTEADGLLFPVEGLGEKQSRITSGGGNRINFRAAVAEWSALVDRIYLCIDPTLPFVATGALHLVDIVGDGSSQVCIRNEHSQRVIAAILAAGMDIVEEVFHDSNANCSLEGVVVDCVNLWPMGAREGEFLELTCFCSHCTRYFETHHKGLLGQFKRSPNPWNLALRASDTGISHMNRIRSDITAAEIVGQSRVAGYAKAFGDADDALLIQEAEYLQQYLQARHTLTLASLDRIFDWAFEGFDPRPKRVLILEGLGYDWTSGLQLDRLDWPVIDGELHPYDQLWFDPADSDLILHNVEFRSYMWNRSRYYLDAFFQFFATAGDPRHRATTGLARLPDAYVKEMLRGRMKQAVGTAMTSRTSLTVLPPLKNPDLGPQEVQSQRVGYVGVALTEDIGDAYVQALQVSAGLPDGKGSKGMEKGE